MAADHHEWEALSNETFSPEARRKLEPLLDEYDIARLNKCSVSSVRRDRRLKKGCPWLKLGALVRYRPSDYEAWLASLAR
jgi:hypothetical protein